MSCSTEIPYQLCELINQTWIKLLSCFIFYIRVSSVEQKKK